MVGKRLLEFRKSMTGEVVSFRMKKYFVYSDSRIWNHDLKRFLSQYETSNGYMAVNLRDNSGKQHTAIGVHDLVATCFLRLLEQGEHTHHVDKNRKNNNLSNLEIINGGEHTRQHNYEKWENGTFDGVAAQVSERTKKSWAAGVYQGNSAKMKKVWSSGRMDGVSEKIKKAWADGRRDCQKKQVAQLSLDGRLIKVWPSTHECHRNGWNRGAVGTCCRNCYHRPGNNVYKNYVWQWYNDYLSSQPTAREQFEARQIYLDLE